MEKPLRDVRFADTDVYLLIDIHRGEVVDAYESSASAQDATVRWVERHYGDSIILVPAKGTLFYARDNRHEVNG